MSRLATYTNRKKWSDIAKEHSGKQPRHEYSQINKDPAFDTKVVIRGMFIPNGGTVEEVTKSGFLENETGKIIAGVKNIPASARDTEPERT